MEADESVLVGGMSVVVAPDGFPLKGYVEVLQLRPGDVLLFTVTDPRMPREAMLTAKEVLGARFPDHEVVIVVGATVSIGREPYARLPECVERWPGCEDGAYSPSCCRFPKSCSCAAPRVP